MYPVNSIIIKYNTNSEFHLLYEVSYCPFCDKVFIAQPF